MAVIPSIPGLEVQICVNGSSIRERRNNIRSLYANFLLVKTVAKKIEFTEGDRFEISLRVHDPFTMDFSALVMKVKVNGKALLSRLLRKTQYEKSRSNMTLIVDGVEDRVGGKLFKRKLKCHRPLKNLERNVIDLTLEDSLTCSDSTFWNGRIIVEVYRAGVYLPTEESKAEDVRRIALSAIISSDIDWGKSRMHIHKLSGKSRKLTSIQWLYSFLTTA
ncbi:hypothetical protein BGZ60DRAFT_225175 [Tricladium varicosporioides]|nr:hypothetical protein BGZ60DRAFT_225175 [Hymenoscyphus varicosporioides]